MTAVCAQLPSVKVSLCGEIGGQAKLISRQRSSKRMSLTWIAARLAIKKCALNVARANLFAMLALVSANPYFFKSLRQLVIGDIGAL